MRSAWIVCTLLLAVALTTSGCSRGRETSAPVSAPQANKPVQTAQAAGDLPGDAAALKATLAQKGPVSFQIITAAESVADKNAYLDTVAGNPEKSTLVLVIFTKDNHDIRFAMGADFFERKVTVDEMLGLVRTTYFPKAKQSDPAGGLADLIRAVNQRMAK